MTALNKTPGYKGPVKNNSVRTHSAAMINNFYQNVSHTEPEEYTSENNMISKTMTKKDMPY